MNSDFYELLIRLADAEVDFVVVGGFAAAVYGCDLVTQDIDICCDFCPENLMRLQSAIADLNPVHRMTPSRRRLELTSESVKNFRNLYLDTDIGQLDCIGEVKGVGDFEQVKQKSDVITLHDRRFQVLDLEALIDSKKAMDRSRDRQTVLLLEAIKRLKEKQKHGK